MLPLTAPPAIPAPESLGVLLAQARKAREAGRLAEAIQAYDAMLAQVPDHETALQERAETLGWAGRYAEAREGYLAFRKAFPARAYTADLGLARLAAWQNHTAEALDILDAWVKQERRQALLDAATYLSWGGRLPESLALVRRWQVAHPDDREALLLEARVLSWSGRNAEARAAFGRVLAQAPGDGEALSGLARLALWAGDPDGARRILDRMGPAALAAPECQVLLAQVEAAQGQVRKARRRAETQVRGASRRDAQGLLEDFNASQGPWVELSADRTDTSEGLRTENPLLRARVPAGDGALTLGLGSHRSDYQGSLRHPSDLHLGLAYPFGPRLQVRGGLSRLSDVGGRPTWGYAFGLGWSPLVGLSLDLARERSLALFTPAATDLRTVLLSTNAALTWRFGQDRHTLSGGLGRADISSTGTDRTSVRRSWSASYEYHLPVTALDLRAGLLTRNFGYDPSLPLGFFNPERFHWDGAFGSATWRRDRRLELALSAQAGGQSVNGGATRFTWAYRAGLTWSPRPWPADLTAGWSQTVAGLPVTAVSDPSAYREHTLSLGLRIRGNHWIW